MWSWYSYIIWKSTSKSKEDISYLLALDNWPINRVQAHAINFSILESPATLDMQLWLILYLLFVWESVLGLLAHYRKWLSKMDITFQTVEVVSSTTLLDPQDSLEFDFNTCLFYTFSSGPIAEWLRCIDSASCNPPSFIAFIDCKILASEWVFAYYKWESKYLRLFLKHDYSFILLLIYNMR